MKVIGVPLFTDAVHLHTRVGIVPWNGRRNRKWFEFIFNSFGMLISAFQISSFNFWSCKLHLLSYWCNSNNVPMANICRNWQKPFKVTVFGIIKFRDGSTFLKSKISQIFTHCGDLLHGSFGHNYFTYIGN